MSLTYCSPYVEAIFKISLLYLLGLSNFGEEVYCKILSSELDEWVDLFFVRRLEKE